MEHRLYYWKISCIIGRPIVVLEDQLYYWKSTVLLEDLLRCWKMNGRSKVLLENQLYWRQSTGLDENYRSRKMTARRWLHKYVGAECGASSFTCYLYQMFNTDVRLSVRLSATPFWLCCHQGIIMKFSGVITYKWSDVHAKGQGQRSKVNGTEVNTQISRFRTATPVWSHIWWWNDARAWCCLGEVPYCFSRSSVKFLGHTAKKIIDFDQNWAFPDCNFSLNPLMAMKWCTKLEAT